MADDKDKKDEPKKDAPKKDEGGPQELETAKQNYYTISRGVTTSKDEKILEAARAYLSLALKAENRRCISEAIAAVQNHGGSIDDTTAASDFLNKPSGLMKMFQKKKTA